MFKSSQIQWPKILFGGLREIFGGIGPKLNGISNAEKVTLKSDILLSTLSDGFRDWKTIEPQLCDCYF